MRRILVLVFAVLLITLLVPCVHARGNGESDYDPDECDFQAGSDCTLDLIGTDPSYIDEMCASGAAQYCNEQGSCNEEHLNALDESKKDTFFENINDFSSLKTQTILDNAQYIDGNSDKFINHYNTLPAGKQKELRNNLGEFKGEITEETMDKLNTVSNLENFWDNYEVGDISNFFSGLSFNEMVAAIKSFMKGPSKLTELGSIDAEAVTQAFQEKGHDVTLDYTEDNEIILEQDTLTVNNNTFNLSQFDGNITANGTVTVNNNLEVQNAQNIHTAGNLILADGVGKADLT